ncbi:MAG: DUF2281 domain-containing protein [Candidatus Latescibacteria bacterium]|nr:DUF2281 domain-containing protein [Candidatus Latescibacterota bacterium]
MTTVQTIIQHLETLPDTAQREVLQFIEFIEYRQQELKPSQEDRNWSDFSLAAAMRGMEDEETPYTLDDLKDSSS